MVRFDRAQDGVGESRGEGHRSAIVDQLETTAAPDTSAALSTGAHIGLPTPLRIFETVRQDR